MAVSTRKKIWFILLIVLYLGAGINHFINADFYRNVMPIWIPSHLLLIQISGAVEIILAILLIFPATQHAAAWLISAMLVVFLLVIHIPMLFNFKGWDDWVWWVAIVRLPVQYFLIVWAWRYSRGEKTINLFKNKTAA